LYHISYIISNKLVTLYKCITIIIYICITKLFNMKEKRTVGRPKKDPTNPLSLRIKIKTLQTLKNNGFKINKEVNIFLDKKANNY